MEGQEEKEKKIRCAMNTYQLHTINANQMPDFLRNYVCTPGEVEKFLFG